MTNIEYIFSLFSEWKAPASASMRVKISVDLNWEKVHG